MIGESEHRESDGRFGKGHRKGLPRPSKAGRRKGTPNKTTRAVKDFLASLCDSGEVQDAVKARILKGDTIGFFRALDHVIGKPKETGEQLVHGELVIRLERPWEK